MTSDEIKTSGYKDLLVWQKGIALVKQVYRITCVFPAEEKFGLVSQMRRAAVSIPSNLAEGQARHTKGEFVQFISHAEGSVAELDTQLIIAVQLAYCTQAQADSAFELLSELRRMLNALRRRLTST
ncbi:MAG TPA: four helix bundle protein [Pyrinomonadaceae bacterium]|nr:four helix bundle protein [Pyrinomonadaceae bacterium]